MASCELCGKKPPIYNCEIEGTTMSVCEDCSRFGKKQGKTNVRVIVQENKKPISKDPEYVFVQGYGMLVKNAREKLGLKQEDFAKKINEHKSLIHQVESEHIKPSVMFARKLERALHIKIIEEVKPGTDENTNSDNKDRTSRGVSARPQPKQEGVTLGDMIHFKKK